MKRGEVWLVNFDPQIGSEIKKARPGVIVEREPFTRLRRTTVVAYSNWVVQNAAGSPSLPS